MFESRRGTLANVQFAASVPSPFNPRVAVEVAARVAAAARSP